MSQGFTDRPNYNDGSPESREMVPLVVNLHLMRPLSILVSGTGDDASQVWLPRKLIEIEPIRLGRTLRIRVPRWKALETGLLAAAGAGQQQLF